MSSSGAADGEWFRIEVLKALGQRIQHCRAEHMSNIEHDIVGSPMLDEMPAIGS